MVFLFIILSLLIYFWWWSEDRRTHEKFPPGPRRYPLIGVLPTLLSNYSKPTVLFEGLAKTYGDIIFLSVGTWEAVVFNSSDAIIDILGHEKAADRDILSIPFVKERQKGKNLGLVFSAGKTWITLRNFTIRSLRNFGLGKSRIMECIILEEVDNFLKHFDDVVDSSSDGAILLRGSFDLSITNVYWRLVTGDNYKLNDDKMMRLVKMTNTFVGASSFACDASIWFPVLRKIFPKTFAKSEVRLALQGMEEFAKESISERRTKGNYVTDQKALLDCFLEKLDENQNKNDSIFNDEQVLHCVLDLFLGSADTSSTALEFGVQYLLHNPKVQEKVQQEIDSVIPRNSKVDLNHLPLLPYVQATILEMHRCTSIVPFVPRTAVEDFTFRGYLIKKGTYLLTNLKGHHYSEKVWGDPYTFRPERFLTAEGKIDSKLAELVLAFGSGKRLCIGKQYADATIFLYFTTLLKNYTFKKAIGKELPEPDPTGTFMEHPKPFHVCIEKRSRN